MDTENTLSTEFIVEPFDMIHQLSSLGIPNPEEFIDVLIESKAVIAGSFAIQCLINEKYEGSDIDIFHFEGNNNSIYSKINQYVYNGCSHDKSIYEHPSTCTCTPCMNVVTKQSDDYLINSIKTTSKIIVKFDKFEPIIFNFVVVKEYDGYGGGLFKTLKDFILNDFDLSFCQTWFDGYNMFYRLQTLHKNGWISNKSLIKNKQGWHIRLGQTFDQGMVDQRCLDRITKYEGRGFTLYNSFEDCPVGSLTLPMVIV